jgi:iron complex outermembrane receptor protein
VNCYRRFWLSAAAVCIPLASLAEDFDDFGFDLPVVTSASRLSQSVLTSPSMVTVIDSDMIEASGFIEIPDLFRLVPGFIVAHAAGDTITVNSHGEGWEFPTRMQLLIDGRSTYTSSLSAIDWNAIGIQIEDIDRIEVVHGPAASAYGSNSFAGAINIITKRPELDDKVYLKYRHGSHQERYAILRHSGQFNDLSYSISASKRQNGGYEDYIETRVDPGSNQERFFDDYRDDRDLNNFNLTGSYQANTKNNVWFNFSSVTGEAEMVNIEPEVETAYRDPFFLERDRKMDAWSANGRWTHHITESQELKLNFFHNYYDTDDMAQTALLSDFFGVTPAIFEFVTGIPDQSTEFGLRSYHSRRSDVEVQYSQINQSGVQFIVGAGLRYDTMESESAFPLLDEQSNMGKRFFANAEMPITKWLSANIGGLYELNNIERPRFSPRASLNFLLNEQQSIRFGYARAYRIPGLYEKYINAGIFVADGTLIDSIFTSSDDLHSEEITSWDVSYLGRMSSAPLSWEIRLYKEAYRDSLGFVRDKGAADDYKYIDNVGNSDMYGIEGHLTYRPTKTSFIRFHFNKGHESGARQHEINPVEYLPLSDTAPDKVYGILAAKQYNNWQFNVGYYHVGKVKWSGTIGDEVDSYDRVDASVSRTFKLTPHQKLIFKLAGQNVLDEDYNEFSTDTDLPFEPRYYGSITLLHN